MSITSIVPIADRLLNGKYPKQEEENGNRGGKTRNGDAKGERNGGVYYTPSSGNGSDAATEAGLFQFEQIRFAAVNATTGAGNSGAGAQGNAAAEAAPAAAVATTAPAVGVTTTGATNATGGLSSQDLQTLNSALTALGLNQLEIQAFDQFAGLIAEFSPDALKQLEAQLPALAQQVTGGTANGAAGTTKAPAFSLTELSVSFKGVNGTETQGGTTTQFSAYQLEIREARVTLTAGNGQTVQATAPQPATATGGATGGGTTGTKATAASAASA